MCKNVAMLTKQGSLKVAKEIKTRSDVLMGILNDFERIKKIPMCFHGENSKLNKSYTNQNSENTSPDSLEHFDMLNS